MRSAGILAAAFVAATGAACRGPAPAGAAAGTSDPTAAITAVLRDQESAWNRGDLAAFMELGYWRSPQLTFYSGGEVSHGFDEMLTRYRRNYEAPGKERGTLAFTQLDVVPLADGVAMARGRWNLDFAGKKDVGGLFTLVLRRSDDGWRIVHDHTSVDG